MPDGEQEPPDLMKIADSVGAFLEVASGYRLNAIKNGFSEDGAEEMALELHRYLLDMSLRQSR